MACYHKYLTLDFVPFHEFSFLLRYLQECLKWHFYGLLLFRPPGSRFRWLCYTNLIFLYKHIHINLYRIWLTVTLYEHEKLLYILLLYSFYSRERLNGLGNTNAYNWKGLPTSNKIFLLRRLCYDKLREEKNLNE